MPGRILGNRIPSHSIGTQRARRPPPDKDASRPHAFSNRLDQAIVTGREPAVMTYISLVKRFGIILCLITAACSAASHAEDSVRVAQDRLRTLGYDPGASDGVYGDKSRQAVHRFQADRKLKQSGELDRETAELLLADLVLYTQNFDPFHYANPVTGELDGPAVQLIKKTCADARLRCVLRLGDKSWEETQKQVRDGSGDGLFLIGWDASRAEYLQRTEEILSTEYGFFVRADDPLNFTGPKALDGYTVGVYGPSNTSKTLDKITVGLRSEGIRLDKDLQKDSSNSRRTLIRCATIAIILTQISVGQEELSAQSAAEN